MEKDIHKVATDDPHFDLFEDDNEFEEFEIEQVSFYSTSDVFHRFIAAKK